MTPGVVIVFSGLVIMTGSWSGSGILWFWIVTGPSLETLDGSLWVWVCISGPVKSVCQHLFSLIFWCFQTSDVKLAGASLISRTLSLVSIANRSDQHVRSPTRSVMNEQSAEVALTRLKHDTLWRFNTNYVKPSYVHIYMLTLLSLWYLSYLLPCKLSVFHLLQYHLVQVTVLAFFYSIQRTSQK